MLELVPFFRAQDLDEPSDLSDTGWQVFWVGETETHLCNPDGSAEPGSKSVLDLLHDCGCSTTSDFGAILTTLNSRDLSKTEAARYSDELSNLTNTVTTARRMAHLP